MLVPHNRVPREGDSIVREAEGRQLSREPLLLGRAPGDIGAVLLQLLLYGSSAHEQGGGDGAEKEQLAEAIARRRDVDAVVLAIDDLVVLRLPYHVGELVETAPLGHPRREVRLVALHERHRPLEQRLQGQSHLGDDAEDPKGDLGGVQVRVIGA